MVKGVVASKNPFGVMMPCDYTVTINPDNGWVKDVNIDNGMTYVPYQPIQSTYQPIYVD